MGTTKLVRLITLMLTSQFLWAGCDQSYSVIKNPDPAKLEFGMGSSTSNVMLVKNESWNTLTSYDAGRSPLGAVSKSYVDIRNIGEVPAVLQNVEIKSAGNLFTLQSKCSDIVLPGERCRLYFLYAPDTIGKTPGTLNVQYDNGYSASRAVTLPIDASANNLAFLKFEVDSIDIQSNTIGYTLSTLFKVIYNGTAFAGRGISILPAKGVILSNPTDGAFQIDPGADTTCGETIDHDCYIKINFSPTTTGAKQATFTLGYFNGSEVLKINAEVKGTGEAAVQLATLNGGVGNFGNVVSNPSAGVGMSIPVSFSGSIPATAVVISGTTNPVFTISNDPNKTTCKNGIISGTCSIYVTFFPTANQAYSDVIRITYQSNSQARPATQINLSGNGVPPALLSTNQPALNLGTVPTYKPVSSAISFTNRGGVAVSALSAISSSDTTDFTVGFDGSCASLQPGSSCNLNVTFKPRSAGSLNTNLQFTYFDGRVTQTVKVSASGVSTSPLVLEGGGTVNFGNVMYGHPTLPSAGVGVAIYGTTLLSTSGQLVYNPSQLSSPYSLSTGSCVAPLNPNSSNSCGFNVAVTANTGFPLDTPITQNFSLGYTGDGNNGSGSLSFATTMILRAPPVLEFTASQYAFSTVSANDSSDLRFTVHNRSPYFATAYREIAIAGGSAFSLISTNCQGGLSPGGYCDINLRFKASASGAQSGTLTYKYNNQIADQSISIGFTAEASSKITLKPNTTTLDFGTVYVGDPVANQSISFSVFGTDAWTHSNNVAAPYSIAAASCGGAGPCTYTVTFTPTAEGAFNSDVTMTYAPGLPNPSSHVLHFRGTAVNRAPTLAVSPTQFPKTLIGQQSIQTISIRNSGTTTAQNLAITLQSADGAFVYTSDGAPGSSGNCAASASLAPGASCNIKVAFKPVKLEGDSANIAITFAGGTQSNWSSNTAINGNGTKIMQVYAGAYQTCLNNEYGYLICWGRNSSGQSGQGNQNAINQKPQTLAAINFGSKVEIQKVSVGDSHTCAVVRTTSQSGVVTCWGSNEGGRLGLGVTDALTTSPVDGSNRLRSVNLGTSEEAIDIAAGFEHTCALLKSGKIKCWGGNTSGQLGIDSNLSVGSQAAQMGDNLKAVNLPTSATAISAGAGHTCATLIGGKSRCWGDNFYGQLGQGRTDEKIGTHAGDLATLNNIVLANSFEADTTLASNGAFTCAKTIAGVVKCFGKTVAKESSATPFWGVLGSCWARAAYNSAAVPCSTNPGVAQSTSVGYLAADMGQSLPLVDFGSVASAQLAVGSSFVCALGSDSQVRCFGMNDRGQLGTGTAANIGAAPAEMGANLKVALSNAANIALGYEHACSVLKDNTVKCWGASSSNATGLVGFGLSADSGNSPSSAPGALPVVYDGR